MQLVGFQKKVVCVFVYRGHELPKPSEKICTGSVSARAHKILCYELNLVKCKIARLHVKMCMVLI